MVKLLALVVILCVAAGTCSGHSLSALRGGSPQCFANGVTCTKSYECCSNWCAAKVSGGKTTVCTTVSPTSPPPPPSPKPTSPPTSNRDPSTAGGTLFIYLESVGFDVEELQTSNNKVPNPRLMHGISTVAVVANAASKSFTTQWTQAQSQQYFGNFPMQKWLSVCCDAFQAQLQNAFGPNLDQNRYGVHGVAMDKESSAYNSANVQTLAKLSANLGIKLALTTAPNKPSAPFDYRLGQAYTEGTVATYYDPSRAGIPSASFWSEPSLNKGKGDVTMVCGSGNCQESLPFPVTAISDTCYDERLSGAQIEQLYNQGPGGDFAVWYGDGQQRTCEPSVKCYINNHSECSLASGCTWNANLAKGGSGAICTADFQCKSNVCAYEIGGAQIGHCTAPSSTSGLTGLCIPAGPLGQWGNQLTNSILGW